MLSPQDMDLICRAHMVVEVSSYASMHRPQDSDFDYVLAGWIRILQ